MTNFIQKYNSTIYVGLLCAIAFCIPIYKTIVPVLIILLVLNWLLSNGWKEKMNNLAEHKIYYWPMLYFLVYCIGLLYTQNIEAGFRNVETKLAFLFLPMVIGSSQKISMMQFKKILVSFLIGCLVSIVFLLCHAVYNYYNEINLVKAGIVYDTYININYFFASLLAFWHHPSYLSMYLVLAIVIIFHFINASVKYGFSNRQLILLIFLIPVFISFILLLASKMGIVAAFVVLLLEMIVFFWRTGRIKSGIVLFAAISLFSFIIIYNSPIIQSRFLYLFQPKEHVEDKTTSIESNTSRSIAWECAFKLIKASPMTGYGTGDAQDVLVNEYLKSNYMGVYAEKLNAHNQFFQSALALGIAGVLSLIFIFLAGIRRFFLTRSRMGIIFLCLVLLNIIVESMFETEGGVVFFVFFYCLFFATEIRVKNSGLNNTGSLL